MVSSKNSINNHVVMLPSLPIPDTGNSHASLSPTINEYATRHSTSEIRQEVVCPVVDDAAALSLGVRSE